MTFEELLESKLKEEGGAVPEGPPSESASRRDTVPGKREFLRKNSNTRNTLVSKETTKTKKFSYYADNFNANAT